MFRSYLLAALLAPILLALPADAHLLMLRGGGSSGGTGTQITTITLFDTSGTNQTNVPVTIGLPLAQGALPSGDKIEILDSDGVTALPVQEDNRASDLGGNVRFVGLTVIVPSLSANQTKTLTVDAVSGTPVTGTDIAESDILATSYDYTDTFNDHDGNTYTCSARTGLAAGAYTNTTTAATLGTFRHGGGLATEYIVMVPPTTTGGTPHPQLRCLFDVLAFKAGSGAVSGSNPILSIRTDAVVETGWIQDTTQVTDDWYGLTETSRSTTISYPNSTPMQTLTIANNTTKVNTTATANSALFTSNSLGSLITDGTGLAVIVGYTSPTQVSVNLYKAFASSTLSGSGYTIYGVAHPYGSRYRERIWWSGLTVPQYAANLGSAWNNSTLTGGPFSYVDSTKMVLNYATPASSITNDLTNLTADGTNPVSYTASSIGQDAGSSFAGDIEMYIGNTGENHVIGVQSDWDTNGLIRYDSNALTAIFGDADKGNLMPINMRNPATGLQVTMNNGTDWVWDKTPGTSDHWGGTKINLTNYNSSATDLTNWTMENAHMGQFFYLPYILTGDWYWLDSLEMMGQYLWMGNNPDNSGSQLNRLILFSNQQRGAAWSLRTIGELALLTPDNNSSVEGWTKSQVDTWLGDWWSATNSGTYNVAPYPGAVISYLDQTGSGLRYATDGPRWVATGDNDNVMEAQWQLGYFTYALFHMKELGMLDSNGLSMLSWAGEGITSAANDNTEVRPEYAVHAYWSDTQYPVGTNLSTWPQIYGAMAVNPLYSPGNSRTLSSTLTLSALSGTAISATLPTGNFNGGSFYVGGWIMSTTGDGGKCLITAVAVNSPSGSDTLTCSTSGSTTHGSTTTNGAAFTSLTYTAGNYKVPAPAPGDPIGTEMSAYLANPSNDYHDIAHGANIMLNQDGYAGEPAALNTVEGWGTAWTSGWGIKWAVNAR